MTTKANTCLSPYHRNAVAACQPLNRSDAALIRLFAFPHLRCMQLFESGVGIFHRRSNGTDYHRPIHVGLRLLCLFHGAHHSPSSALLAATVLIGTVRGAETVTRFVTGADDFSRGAITCTVDALTSVAYFLMPSLS